jgi:hypothetical protein
MNSVVGYVLKTKPNRLSSKTWTMLKDVDTETGDASELMKLLPRNKQLAMTALANLAKFTGRDDLWLRIRQKYDLKWSNGDSIQSFRRFFDDGLNYEFMLQRIKEIIQKCLPYPGGQYHIV